MLNISVCSLYCYLNERFVQQLQWQQFWLVKMMVFFYSFNDCIVAFAKLTVNHFTLTFNEKIEYLPKSHKKFNRMKHAID